VNVRSAKGVLLTRREREIVTLVAEGLTNNELDQIVLICVNNEFQPVAHTELLTDGGQVCSHRSFANA
jgi:hypothetical protein